VPPARPTIPTLTGSMDFVVAVHHVDMGDHPDAAPETIGYDLDNACTTDTTGATRVPRGAVSFSAADGDGGIDNATSELIRSAPGDATGSAAPNDSAESGQFTTAIQVLGYNGYSVEETLGVAYYSVTMHPAADGGAAKPSWDGNDAWDVFSPWLADPGDGGAPSLGSPRYVDRGAWVTPGPTGEPMLVSEFHDEVLFGAAVYHLQDVILTADIVASPHGWSLANGILAGRVPIDDLVHALAFSDAPNGMPNCQGEASYMSVKGTTCAFADISLLGPDNGKLPCDAASWAWRIVDTAPIQLAGVRFAGLPAAGACEAGASPLDDHCDP